MDLFYRMSPSKGSKQIPGCPVVRTAGLISHIIGVRFLCDIESYNAVEFQHDSLPSSGNEQFPGKIIHRITLINYR